MNNKTPIKYPKLCITLWVTIIFNALISVQVYAKDYYISQKLTLGIHTQASLNSPIKALINSGDAVQVIKKTKNFSQIKTSEGKMGWVKSQFLTDQKNTELSTKEKNYQAQQLKDRQTITQLNNEIKAWEQLDTQDKQAKNIQSQQQQQQLEQRLKSIAAIAMGKEPENISFNNEPLTLHVENDKDVPASFSINNWHFSEKDLLMLLMASGVSFLLGIFIMDVFNRRRHGGYRV